MSFKVVIPARYHSQRLPGKPLVRIAGRELVRWVYECAQASAAGEVIVATESERVVSACRSFGAPACLTADRHRSGTDRIAEVAEQRGWEPGQIVVNLQGDEPLMPCELVDQVAALLRDSDAAVATLAWPVESAAELLDTHVVKVVTDAAGYALYFSRAPVPWHRDRAGAGLASQPCFDGALRHIGLYAYRVGELRRLAAAAPCLLEEAEKLEQLRALWLGMRIRVDRARVLPGPGVDTPGDVERVARLLQQRAEGVRT